MPTWTLWLLRAQLGLVYFYAGLAKLNSDWLQGRPLRSWLEAESKHSWLGPLLAAPGSPYLMSYGGLLLDLFVVPLLLWRKTRVAAFVLAVSFHLANAVVFGIGVFPWLMIAATALFFAPDWPRRVFGFGPVVPQGFVASAPVPRRRRRAVVCALAVYLTVQLVLPLRHHAYPGDVAWTEEGHRFAWRMKLRSKGGWSRFTVTDPKSGKTWPIRPADHLTPKQNAKMSGVPDMVLDFAHELARRKKAEGYGVVEVRARVLTSLNGRPKNELLVDPTVDLVQQPRSLAPASWILPLDKE